MPSADRCVLVVSRHFLSVGFPLSCVDNAGCRQMLATDLALLLFSPGDRDSPYLFLGKFCFFSSRVQELYVKLLIL